MASNSHEVKPSLAAGGAISSIIGDFSINFCSLILEAMPFMFFGTLSGGLIEVFLPAKLIDRFFKNGRTVSLLLSGAMGLAMPTCECAIVPIVCRLIMKGVPVPAFNALMDTPFVAILLMMGLAIVLNLCSEADAFISASFRWLLPGSAQMGFMVLGPMLDLKLLLMYLSVFRKGTIPRLSTAVFLVVLGMMVLIELVLPPFI